MVSTFADSYLHASSHSARGAAEIASVRKESKYSLLPQTTSSNQSHSRRSAHWTLLDSIFLFKIGRRLSVVSGDPREISFLFQRLFILLDVKGVFDFTLHVSRLFKTPWGLSSLPRICLGVQLHCAACCGAARPSQAPTIVGPVGGSFYGAPSPAAPQQQFSRFGFTPIQKSYL